MLSKNKIKLIQSLARKKVRDQERIFLVEGDKMVMEAVHSDYSVEMLCATDSFLNSGQLPPDAAREVITVSDEEIRKASLLQSPQHSLAVVKMKEDQFSLPSICNKLSLALDFIQDPGNLGTMIRTADWFGIEYLLCSDDTVDCYNPKVIQASMGAIFRVKVYYLSLAQILQQAVDSGIPVFGTFLDGENLYSHPLSSSGILVMGNEGNGISEEVEKTVSQRLFIPPYPESTPRSESLNVATATAICCAEFRRRHSVLC